VVIRVGVVDPETAGGLIPLVAQEVDAERVCFEPSSQQVCIEVERNPDQTLVRILNLVEEWLGAGGHAPTRVEIDDHTYVLGAKTTAGVAL
jgi:hypothetical protein